MGADSGVGGPESLVRRLGISAILFDGRPVRTHGQGWRCEFGEFGSGVNDLPANDCEDRFKLLNVLFRDGKVVRRKDGEIRQLSRRERALLVVFRREPTAPERVELQSFLLIEAILRGVETQAPDRLTGDEPVEREEWIVTRHSGRVRAGSDG